MSLCLLVETGISHFDPMAALRDPPKAHEGDKQPRAYQDPYLPAEDTERYLMDDPFVQTYAPSQTSDYTF
jgi:hypothetical protein